MFSTDFSKKLTRNEEYFPLPELLSIGKSEIHGLGLFPVEEMPAGTVLGITHVENKEFQHGWIRTPLGGFYNHSDTPNCYLRTVYLQEVEVRELVTLKDLRLGDELTCTYSLWNIDEHIGGSDV